MELAFVGIGESLMARLNSGEPSYKKLCAFSIFCKARLFGNDSEVVLRSSTLRVVACVNYRAILPVW